MDSTSTPAHIGSFVPETAFGIWFLRTYTWEHHVLRVAINDLKRLITKPLSDAPILVDVGCGQGISFRLLEQAFAPQRIIGVDCHAPSLEAEHRGAPGPKYRHPSGRSANRDRDRRCCRP